MKKVKKYCFRSGTVSDGSSYCQREIYVKDGLLFFGARGFTKSRVQKMLKTRKGSFICAYRYVWKFNRDGSVVFGRFGYFDSTLPKRLVDRIRKWARS